MQKSDKTMQIRSIIPDIDHHEFTSAAPFKPYGVLNEHVPGEKFCFMHTHNFLELGWCTSGSGVFNIGSKIATYSAPAVSVIFAGQPHSAQSNPGLRAEWHFLYLDAALAMPDFDAAMLAAQLKRCRFGAGETNIIAEADDPLLYSLVVRIITEAAAAGDGHRSVIQGALAALLSLYDRRADGSEDETVYDSSEFVRIEPALNFINAHFDGKIRMDRLAAECCVSVSALRRLFVSAIGIPPEEYLHKVRVSNAASRLLSSSRRIIDIAFECGYQTLSCFNRQFVKFYGESPSVWRLRCGGGR